MKTNKTLLFGLAVLFLVTLTQCKKEKALPAACFTSSPTVIRAGTDVTFTNCTTSGVTYVWSFGDGESSLNPSPTHTYASAGTYTVTLTASNGDGSTSKSTTITVLPSVIGAYAASEFGSISQQDNFNITIGVTSGQNYRVTNFYNSQYDIAMSLNGNVITIPNQAVAVGYTVSGSGTVSGTTISVSYVISDGTNSDNVTGTWTKQ